MIKKDFAKKSEYVYYGKMEESTYDKVWGVITLFAFGIFFASILTYGLTA